MPNAIKEIIEMNKKSNNGVGGAAIPQGSSLPPVTSDDNGDVLTVVDGAWAPAAPTGGGGGGETVIITFDQSGMLSETWQTIYDGLANGTRFVIITNYAEEGYVERTLLALTYASGGNGEYYIQDTSQGKEFVAIASSADGYPVISPI